MGQDSTRLCVGLLQSRSFRVFLLVGSTRVSCGFCWDRYMVYVGLWDSSLQVVQDYHDYCCLMQNPTCKSVV